MKRRLLPLLPAAALALLAVACPTATAPEPTPDALEMSVTPRVDGLSLAWRDPPGRDIHHFEIGYAPDGPARPIRISTNVGRVVIVNLDAGKEYSVTVKAVSNSGAASAGLTLNARPLAAAGDLTPPPDVAGLRAAPGFGAASLTWESPDLADVAAILVFRSPGPEQPAVLPYYETAYSESGLVNGTVYTYTVRTRDQAGNVSGGRPAAVLPSAAIDSSPPRILSVSSVPSIAHVGDAVAIAVRVLERESAFRLAFDTDGDGAFDDPGVFTPQAAGIYPARVQAESAGGISYESLDVLVSAGAAPAIVHSGQYIIEGEGAAAAIAALAAEGATVVAGDLYIRNTALRDLRGLEALRSVSGSVYIYGNPQIEDMTGLGNLADVNGNFYLYDGSGTGNASLVTLDGLGLGAVRGTLGICYCPSLADISALRTLTSINGLLVAYDYSLVSLKGLEGLACQTNARPWIGYNPVLKDLTALRGLTFQGIDVSYNSSLETLDGLEGLRSDWNGGGWETYIAYNPRLTSLGSILDGDSLAGDVYVGYNESLPSLDGLSAVDMLAGTLYVTNNRSLVDSSALATIRQMGQLEIYDNAILPDLRGLSGLRRVDQNVYIKRNNSLADVSGFNPDYIGGNLELEDDESLERLEGLGAGFLRGNLLLNSNARLASLEGMRLRAMDGNLTITNDPALADLRGLECLANDGEIASLAIEDNPSLASLAGLEKLSRVANGASIQRNRTLRSLGGLDNLASVRGTFHIADNDLLADVSALADLRVQDGDLDFRGNVSLKNLSGLAGLTVSDGFLKLGDRGVWPGCYVESLDGLADLRLERAGVKLENCVFLANIAALGTGLDPTSVGTGFSAYNDDLISSLEPLGSLYIGTMSDLYIENCDLVSELSPFDGVSAFGGSIDLIDLPRLASLAGLGNVATIQGHLQLSGLPALATLSALEDLTFVGTWIRINDDDGLADLDLTSLQSVGSLGAAYIDGDTSVFFITRNDRLVNLLDSPAVGAGLDSLSYVGWSGFLLFQNPMLSQADVVSLRDKFGDVLQW